jgi:hypothetical protein
LVLQPEKLKQMVRQDLSRTLGQYAAKALPDFVRESRAS